MERRGRRKGNGRVQLNGNNYVCLLLFINAIIDHVSHLREHTVNERKILCIVGGAIRVACMPRDAAGRHRPGRCVSWRHTVVVDARFFGVGEVA